MNTKRIIRAAVLVALLVPIGIELALRWLIFGPSLASASTDTKTFPASAPVPYEHSAYWGKQFWQEQQDSQVGWNIQDNYLSLRPDYVGRYINIRNNNRVVVGQPGNATHTLWFIGSSTVYDNDVPDTFTKASLLQARVSYRVEAYGVPSITVDKQVVILKQLPVKAGDIIVFYDGAMDMLSTYRITQNRQAIEPSVCNWLLHNIPWSFLVQFSCTAWQKQTLHVRPDLVEQMRQSYTKALSDAWTYARSHGARFYHFLQPTIYSQSLNSYEHTIALDEPVNEFYAATWPILQADQETIDLTHSLDELRRFGAAIYLDYAHTNEQGNAVIADTIAEHIAPAF